ncbi:MAG: hypothetical protein PHC83_02430 [Bacteroidales bacterium]|nr:hypothetical protein [Bacteroidales bacterium]MDD4209011.1 hypothetical protein [Bacteroidales bacterium]
MKKVSNIIFCVFCIFIETSFGQQPISTSNNANQMGVPPVIIYKTKKNYTKNVAVIMSEDKTQILSYPDPSDVFKNGNYCYPTPLKRKFLLDNRGINKNVVFLSMTYEEYAKLKSPPSLEDMEKMILNKNPIKKMYQCGNRFQYQNIVAELNLLIKKNCKTCTQIK